MHGNRLKERIEYTHFNSPGERLHEYYFESLSKDHVAMPESVKAQIEKDFGSYEKFVAL